jgi:hypothetical protein
MVRRALIPTALLAALLLTVAQGASSSSQRRSQGCRAFPNSSLHWNAVFGHYTSRSQAVVFVNRLQRLGFKGFTLEKDYCDDIEVAVAGIDSRHDRNDFVQEALQAHRTVSFEPPDIDKRPNPDVVKAVFGTLPTLARASKLQLDMAWHGFHEDSDIERLGLHSWRVVVYNVPASGEGDFAAEAASVGYHVTFVQQ